VSLRNLEGHQQEPGNKNPTDDFDQYFVSQIYITINKFKKL